ncbi:MAG: alpha-L-rhamnosidase, partial [Clostridia bacterium]|nr:alpha-L-rhamnosidase [Clostridia bacterium]
IKKEDIKLSAYALYSDMDNIGSFECSDELINRLQSNIVWSAKSNFVDIPTDCPQRDERMGWTGDIAVFAPTACYNFDTSRFLEKWLKDVRAEQLRTGGLPNTVPVQGYGFPATMPKKAVAFWGDAAVFVPWAVYLAGGDVKVLETNYEMMKKYVKAEKFWANFGFGKRRYIWNDIPMMQFGDWVAPDVKTMGEWQARCKWTGTGAIAASSLIMTKVARILGKEEDEAFFKKLHEKVSDAYISVLTDGDGKLKNEFQTAYVLPIYFEIFEGEMKKKAAKNLAELVKKNGYRIGTGFPGTPYILFALADNGEEETAMKLLTSTECPSWLYEVKAGGTTIWEHWDAIREDGTVNGGEEDGTGGMSSFNHYASGAVGDFLYKRVLGVEPTSGGYKTFRFKPVVGGGITYAKGSVETPYGVISADWKAEGGKIVLSVDIPVGTECEVVLPSGEVYKAGNGSRRFEGKL